MTKVVEEPLKFLGCNIQKINPLPGDVFVLMADEVLSSDSCQSIHETWCRCFEDTPPKLIILGKGMRLGVIGREELTRLTG